MINRESAFKNEIIRLYSLGAERKYAYIAHAQEIDDLCNLFVEEYIPEDKLERYESMDIIKMMMKQMTGVWRLDPPTIGREAELIVLVSNVKFDGGKLYIKFKKHSPLKMRRFEMGLSRLELAKKTGYSLETVERCESNSCDMKRQPESLAKRFATALSCEPEELYQKES